MTQLEKLIARIVKLLKENRSRAFHLTILVGMNGELLLWFLDDPVKVEGYQEEKPTPSSATSLHLPPT